MPTEILTNGAASAIAETPSQSATPPQQTSGSQQSTETAQPTTTQPPASSSTQPELKLGDVLTQFRAEFKQSDIVDPLNPLGTAPAQPGQTPAKYTRTFEGLDESETKIFRDMSTDAYKQLYPIYLESKKWKEKEAEWTKKVEEASRTSAYDQENAWKLAPEYDKITRDSSNLSKEIEFCEEQLAKYEAGEPIQWVDPKGNLTEPFKATPRDRATIISTLTRAHTMLQGVEGRRSEFESTYKTRHTGYINGLETTRKNIWKGVDLNTLAEKSKPFLDQFPEYARNKPEVKMLAEGLLMVQALMSQITELQAKLNGKQIQNRIAANGGPTSEQINGGGAKGETVADAVNYINGLKYTVTPRR